MPRAKDVWLPLLLVHASMMAAVIAYGVLGYTFAEEPGARVAMDHTTFIAIFAGLGVATAIASVVLRARLMPPRDAGAGDRIDEALIARAAPALARLRTALILSWAFAEAIAIYGLIATILFHDAADYAPFGAAALVLLLVHAPRPRLIAEVVAAAAPR